MTETQEAPTLIQQVETLFEQFDLDIFETVDSQLEGLVRSDFLRQFYGLPGSVADKMQAVGDIRKRISDTPIRKVNIVTRFIDLDGKPCRIIDTDTKKFEARVVSTNIGNEELITTLQILTPGVTEPLE